MAAITTRDLAQRHGGMIADDNHDCAGKERHKIDSSVVNIAGLQ
jgi:hypothetical protein